MKTLTNTEKNELYAEFNAWTLSQVTKGYSLKNFCRWLAKQLLRTREYRRFGHFQVSEPVKFHSKPVAFDFARFLSLSHSESDIGEFMSSPPKQPMS